jgi:hypothetical protein
MVLLSSSEVTRLSLNPCNSTRTLVVITMFANTHHLCPVDTLISYLFRDNFGTVLLFKFACIKSSAVCDISLCGPFCGVGLLAPYSTPNPASHLFFRLSNTYSKCWQVSCNRNDVETFLLWRLLPLSLRHNYRAVVLHILLRCVHVNVAVIWNSP